MTAERIHTILLGNTRTFVVPGRNGYLLIDGGHRVWSNRFFRCLAKIGVQRRQIRLAVITHVHFDHVGTMRAVKNGCGCKVAVHPREADLLASGQVVIPPGTILPARLLKWMTDRCPELTSRVCAFDPMGADLLISEPKDLKKYGFDARIIPTPGHTEGSLSILTAAGNAFVGDLAVNMPWLGRQRYRSPFGDSTVKMKASIENLVREGVRRFYPAHGRPFYAKKWQEHNAWTTAS